MIFTVRVCNSDNSLLKDIDPVDVKSVEYIIPDDDDLLKDADSVKDIGPVADIDSVKDDDPVADIEPVRDTNPEDGILEVVDPV